MPDKNTVIFGAVTGMIGAAVVAVGNAFGFSSRLGKAEDAINNINENCVTMIRCDEKIESSKELVGIRLDNHAEKIEDLKKSQNEGFKVAYEKLDKLISNGNSK